MQNNNTLSAPLFFCLACLIGMTESIFICFFSFIFFNQFHLIFIVSTHLIEIIILFFFARKNIQFTPLSHLWNIKNLSFIFLVLLCGFIASVFAKAFPYGGWDAWQVWNFKAKFLLLSQTNWKQLFDPLLWQSSPHYPLALPLLNAWTWSFAHGTPSFIPLTNTIIFNMLTAGLIFSVTQYYTRRPYSFAPTLVLFLIPAYVILTSSQYCDVFLGLFFLASMITSYHTHKTQKPELLVLTAIFLGLLSFTKPEGTILAGIIFLGNHFHIFQQEKRYEKIMLFWISTLISFLPTLMFLFFFSPGNQTFINGLTSTTQPSTLLRLKTICAFFIIEITHKKWGFLWLLLFLAAILNLNRIFKKEFFAFYFSISIYFMIIFVYYWINTYFKIDWWISVSLSRILCSLLPAIILWISLGVLSKKNDVISKE